MTTAISISIRADELVAAKWLEAETLEHVRLHSGHFLAAIGNTVTTPHVPSGDLPTCGVKEPKWPLPSELVSSNGFLRDEWAYDPVVQGRIIARDQDSTAVRCANLLIAGRGKAFIALTSRRFAILIEQRDVEGESGVSRFIGVFTKDKAEKLDGKRLVTWWEVDRSALRAVQTVMHGRQYPGRCKFTSYTFADGSILEISDPTTTQLNPTP